MMMTNLSEVFDLALLAEMLEQRYVNRRFHPDYPNIAILNYSEKTQFDNKWNDVTLNCRGLIYDAETLLVLARPWKKFFNLGDAKAAWLEFDAPVEVTDKMDGSLGILYPTPAGWSIATRGSFESDQAKHATELWKTYYEPGLTPNDNYTFLFEIIYKENRIVLDYGTKDDIVLLGCVSDEGHVYGPREAKALFSYFEEWPGETTEVMPIHTISEMLGYPDRDNTEGYVIRQGDRMVKWKRPDYIDLHRLISNLSEKSVWSSLSHGKTAGEICEDLPDEFHGYVKETAAQLEAKFTYAKHAAEETFLNIQALKPVDRRAFAMLASKSPQRAYLFSMYDGKPIDDAIWKSLKPVGETYVNRADIDNE
jgi:RNA ligase